MWRDTGVPQFFGGVPYPGILFMRILITVLGILLGAPNLSETPHLRKRFWTLRAETRFSTHYDRCIPAFVDAS